MLLEAILLSRLKHPNLVEFIGLHHTTVDGFEVPFIVSSWVEFGDIEVFMNTMIPNKKFVPRIRWVDFTAYYLCEHSTNFWPASDLRNSLRASVLA